MFFPGNWVKGVKSNPPLVPEGEKIENIRELVKNISENSWISSIAFSPDGKTLASGTLDGTVHLWSVSTGKEIQRLEGHTLSINYVVFSPDGKTLVAGPREKTVRLWSVANGKELKKFEGHTKSVNSVAFSPIGKTLASGSSDKTVRLWSVSTGKEIQRFKGHTKSVNSIAFSPIGKTLASGSSDKTVRLWSVSTGKEIQCLKGHSSSVRYVAFSPDGKILASGSRDKTVRLWSVSTGKEIQRFKGHTEWVNSVAFSPNGKIIASGSSDGTVGLWSVSTGKEIQRLHGHRMVVQSVAFSPNGKIIASGSSDGTVGLWSVSTGKEIHRLGGQTSQVNSVAFSPDVKTLAVGALDCTVRLWSVVAGKEIQRLEGHTGYVTSVAFSPNGKTVASGSLDKTVRLWSVAAGIEINCLKGYEGGIYAIDFSPDGKTLASASGGQLKFWDTTTGRETKKIPTSIAYKTFNLLGKSIRNRISPDGKTRLSIPYFGISKILLQREFDRKILWTFISGQGENWLSIDAENRVRRYDDGTFLVQKDENGYITPVLPPPSKIGKNGKLNLLDKPTSLETYEGEASEFVLKLKNTGRGRIYWINVVQDIDRDPKNPLIFHPPPTRIILEPGETVALPCKVSCFSHGTIPDIKASTLYLKVTSAYGKPILLKIPVSKHFFQLQLIKSEIYGENKDALLVTLKNTGNQNIPGITEFEANIGGNILEKLSRGNIKPGQTFTLFFELPFNWFGKNDARDLQLTVANLKKPLHIWNFTESRITLPKPAWYQYALLGCLVIVIIIGIYYLSHFLHPLTLKLSKYPVELLHLNTHELGRARSLLKRTRRLDTVLSSVSVSKSLLKNAIEFYNEKNPESQCQLLAERLEAVIESLGEINNLPREIHLFKLRLSSDFMLNVDRCMVVFPGHDIPAEDILSHLKPMDIFNYRVSILITFNENQQTALRKTSLNTENLLVTPNNKELTQLLLSANPLDSLARLIASQVKVTRVSPFQTSGGVDKESIFFGRKKILAHIMQREPGNYFLVGGRQLGKSSLLKALERRYQDSTRVQCHYLVLSTEAITPLLARALKLPLDIDLLQLLEHMSRTGESKHQLFLIDEVDKFIAAEARTVYDTLNHFRSLSEEGKCHFIFAGFWNLYHAAVFDYHSPIKNFGETLRVEALEADACRDLAVKPLSLFNIGYESDQLVERLIRETGCRANLVTIICNEILKQLDMKGRVIRADDLEKAFDSSEVRSALTGWEELTTDPHSNRLDRLIVYSAIREKTFTQAGLMRILDKNRCAYETQVVKQSLERLELAFILKRENQNYTFAVPLFKKMVLAAESEKLLERELESIRKV